MSTEKIFSNDPKEQAQKLENELYDLKTQCLHNAKKLSDPKAKALFETAADVLDGLEKAFSNFQAENEEAWIKDENRPPLQ